jgi:hypothetical protein
MRIRLTVLAVAALLLIPAALVSASTDLGTFCWADNFAGLWKLTFAGFAGSSSFSINGVRVVGFTCNGVSELPVIGTARVVGSSVVMGMETLSNEPGHCIGATWQGVFPLTTGVISGGGRSQSGQEAAFTMTPVVCTAPLLQAPPGFVAPGDLNLGG